jgi:hypothetical protein
LTPELSRQSEDKPLALFTLTASHQHRTFVCAKRLECEPPHLAMCLNK